MGLSTFVICVSFLLYIPLSTMAEISPDTKSFFNEKINGNLTKLTWAHAVNNRTLLDETLADALIMMIEADVVMGHDSTSNSTEMIPIMAHPPTDMSDLSLDEFLIKTIQNRQKGIKLDFKSYEAFDASASIIKKHYMNLTFPVWLNADILSGPVSATTKPVDAKQFLALASTNFSESTLSIGWTTNYGQEANITEGNYTQAQVEEMINVIKAANISQTITYPVRAGLIVNDVDTWKDVLKKTAAMNATLTIWSHTNDSVDAKKLSTFIKTIGVDKIYVDVPDDLRQKLNISAANANTSWIFMMTCAVLVNILFSEFF